MFKSYTDWLYEGTVDYWPGYGDDSIADKLGEIRKKTSKIQNQELRKKEKEILLDGKTDRDKFFQKWRYANMILTSLQDGFYIDETLLDKALDLYKEIIDDPNINEYLKDSKDPRYFIDSIELILTKLANEIKINKGDPIYAPGFLDSKDEDRLRIDKRFGRFYK